MINKIRIRPSLVCYMQCQRDSAWRFSLRVSVPMLLIAWAMGPSAGTGGNCTRAFLFSAAACLLFTCSVTAGDIKLVNPVIKAFVPGSLAFHLTQISQVNIFFIRKAFDIHFDTNESDNKLILLERRFDVIFTSFSSSIKVRYFLIVHMTSS